MSIKSFNNLGIDQKIIEYLKEIKFKNPTPIQYKAIPIANERKDIIGIAQTGTGKTLAFGIPMVQMLSKERGIGLVIVPTRELAMQVDQVIRQIAKLYGLQSVVIIGGASMQMQIKAIKRNPRIIIATPGRLIDLTDKKIVKLYDVKLLVLDEADRMFDMGFAPQIKEIMKSVPKKRQTMLFSATIPHEVVEIATRFMQSPLSVEVAPSGTTAENISQELFIVNNHDKKNILFKHLEQYKGSILIFTRTKHGAKKLNKIINERGYRSAEIHSNRSMSQRKLALEGFKSGRYRILIATDIAARGIDVSDIELVINFDLPDDAENYIHRIGRTARAGKKGHSISLATPDQGKNIKQIERLIKIEIQVSKHPDIVPE
ncbi:DEAD/DEAH box helicase, partial [Candidatus Margulisiibacteriota bacterium]